MPTALQVDPTRTTMLRRKFSADVRRRFVRLLNAIYELVVEEDAFGLKERQPLKFNQRFAFLTSPKKVEAFRIWLQSQIDIGLLSTDNTGKPWTAQYVDSAYRAGVVRAYSETNKETLAPTKDFYVGGREQFLRSSFSQPETVSKIELLATRSFENLKGVTSQMAAQMNRVLSDGIAHGDGPTKIARELRKTANLPKVRAETIARTEVINAHAEGKLDSFEELGIDELGVLAEFSTAGDEKVCPRCGALQGNTYTVDEARGVIPVHPNCRCTWIPAFEPAKKKPRSQSVE
jgi:SPP1 gp7 family putative phage head morphogenesis protein